jgi:hypothetical protein
LLYSPNTPQALAKMLVPLLSDNRKRNALAARGLTAVNTEFNNLSMARNVIALIEKGAR